jgi:tetratricopeptide (TPR) repeat protein
VVFDLGGARGSVTAHVSRQPAPRPTSRPDRDGKSSDDTLRVRLSAALIALLIALVYANSVYVPFVLDDVHGIMENPTIRTLWPPWVPLSPPDDGGTVTNRPVVNLSLAINYAIGGLAVEGYHVGNILIHAATALLLFGLVRRTLLRPWAPEWLRANALPVSLASALIWALHPLHTEAVTFVIQRAEALGALVTTATLYCFGRSTEERVSHAGRWSAATVALCYLGMVTKETLVAAPILVLLYDRTFVSGSFAEAWRRRRGLHLGLFAAWTVLALMIHQGQSRGGGVGFGQGVTAWESLLTQCDAVVMYLRLAFWPAPLVFDYGSSVSDVIRDPRQVIPQAILLVALGVATLWALVRRPPLGFAGAWFFLILAPSSSVVPMLAQMRAEHRMYLPLAALAVPVTVGAFRWLGRAAWVACGAAALALGVATVDRNRDYATPLGLWTDTAAKAPLNPRAHYNVGFELARAGQRAAAIDAYLRAVRLDPDHLPIRTNLATMLVLERRASEALPHAEAAVRIEPDSVVAHNVLGRARFETGDAAGALRSFEQAVRLDPADEGAHRNLGLALIRTGRPAEGVAHLETAAGLAPDAGLLVMIAEARLTLGQRDEARRTLEAALRLQPEHPGAHFQLGNLLAEAGDAAGAIPHLERAVHGMPRAVPPLFNLGLALDTVGRTQEAMRCFEGVLALDPRDADAAEMLRTLRASGR